MMSVFTNLLLLATCLSTLADGTLNEKNDEELLSLSHPRPRDTFSNRTENTSCLGLIASGSSNAPLSSSFATGSGWVSTSSGVANTASGLESSGIVPYPTVGAPYQNSTSLYTKQGNGGSGNFQSGSGYQCPPQQTITLPPQTITLPAQTVTVTSTPDTITITPQVQTETVTVTVTPQTQTTTVTIWMTVTANQAPSCPSPGTGENSQITPVAAPNVQPSFLPNTPVSGNIPAPPVVPPIVTTPTLVVPLSTGGGVPVVNTTSPVIPNLGSTAGSGPGTFPANHPTSPVNQQTSSLVLPIINSISIVAPYPYRNTTNQSLALGSGSSRGLRPTGSGFAKSTGRPLSYLISNFVTNRPLNTTTVGPSPTREYFPGNGSSLLTPPSQANATSSPVKEYFPDDGSSLLAPPAQANATSVSPLGGSTAPIITPAVAGPPQTLAAVVGSATAAAPPPIMQFNISTSIPGISTPIAPPPPPPVVQSVPPPPSTSSSQISPPPNTSTLAVCTNGAPTENMTTDFSEIAPIPSVPLILQGLNYTTFTPTTSDSNSTSPLPPPIRLLAPPAAQPKLITLAPGSLSFSLTSLSLFCGDDTTANCTLQLFGLGAPSASGTASGIEWSVALAPGVQTVRPAQPGWEGLSSVAFSAEVGGVPVVVGLAEVVYGLVRTAC